MYSKQANFLARIYWFIFRPRTRGVKCLITRSGKVLLMRNSYNPKIWNLPGGGVKRNEELEAAVRREVLEELGLNLEQIVSLGSYESKKEYKKDTIHCFSSELASDPSLKLSRTEIIEAKWFNLNQLPNNISTSVLKSLGYALKESKLL